MRCGVLFSLVVVMFLRVDMYISCGFSSLASGTTVTGKNEEPQPPTTPSLLGDLLDKIFTVPMLRSTATCTRLWNQQGGGEDGDAEGLEKMMAAMGGAEGMGGMPGMGGMGAGRSPEDHKKEVEALKAVSSSLPHRATLTR